MPKGEQRRRPACASERRRRRHPRWRGFSLRPGTFCCSHCFVLCEAFLGVAHCCCCFFARRRSLWDQTRFGSVGTTPRREGRCWRGILIPAARGVGPNCSGSPLLVYSLRISTNARNLCFSVPVLSFFLLPYSQWSVHRPFVTHLFTLFFLPPFFFFDLAVNSAGARLSFRVSLTRKGVGPPGTG